MMKEKGAWFIMQPILTDENAMAFPAGSPKDKKFFGVTKGTVQGIQMARKPDVKTAFGTDLIFDPVAAKKQSKMLAKLKQWCTAFEILNMATANNAKLVKMCGPRDP